MNFNLGTIDLSIIVIYLIFVVLLGFYFGKKHEDAEDYFLAGRTLTWPLIGFSLFASNMSSNSLVGLAGAGYNDGFSVYTYEWMAVVILVIFAIFFLPFYLKNKIFTIPEYLEKRFSYPVRAYASSIAIVLNILVDIAATLYAGGVVINMIFPAYGLTTIIIFLAVIAGIYTISGGLAAVVYTDAVQAIILIFGSALITMYAYDAAGGWEAVEAITDPSHFNIIKPIDDEALPYPGIFTGVLIIGFYFWGTNQYITQRTLAAKNVRQGQWGAIFAGFLKLSILFVMVFPGAFARVLYPSAGQDENGSALATALDGVTQIKMDAIYPSLLFDFLPVGILGIVLAGLIAAMMSSLDSGLNSVSTLITMDFYRKFKPDTSSEKLMKVGRITTLIVMIIAVFWAPQIGKFPKLWDYLQQTLAWFSPPVVALFVMGLFFKRINNKGAIAGILVGFTFTIILITNVYLTDGVGNAPLSLPNFLYVAGFHLFISMLAMVIVSYVTEAPPQDKLASTIWTVQEYAEETAKLKELSWYKNYRYQGLALMIIVVIILVWFA
ncbi:MAG: sodium:solute symporter [Saprospiraceae bacterium]|nr:sodium:solute symporter [Saprospiraceae bacterium]